MLDKQASQRRVKCDFLKYLYLGCLLYNFNFFFKKIVNNPKTRYLFTCDRPQPMLP